MHGKSAWVSCEMYLVEDADDDVLCFRGVEHGPHDVEGRPHAQRPTDRRHLLLRQPKVPHTYEY